MAELSPQSEKMRPRIWKMVELSPQFKKMRTEIYVFAGSIPHC
ncbi:MULTISPECIES: hypothetical protein [Bacillaceae]|nr:MULTISPECIES: hypothetical protein [Bacillaceae]